MTVVRSPLQQATTLGKTIIRTPLMVQQGILLYPISLPISCMLHPTSCMSYCYVEPCLLLLFLLVFFSNCLSGQGQQVVTQIIRGTPVSKAVSSSTPTQVVGSTPRPSTPGQPQTPQTPSSTRPQQGQVKLTLAQLTQLTQGAQVCTCLCDCICFSISFTWWHTLTLGMSHYNSSSESFTVQFKLRPVSTRNMFQLSPLSLCLSVHATDIKAAS